MTQALLLGIIVLFFAALLGTYILYLKTAQDVLRAVSPPLRRMRPGQVWLMFIPFFSFIYSFIFADRLASSIAADLQARGGGLITRRPTYAVGLAMSIAQLVFLLPTEYMGVVLLQLGWLVLWIAHWVQVAAVGKKLRALPMVSVQEGRVFAE